MPPTIEENKVDFRVYIGIVLFHWQTILVCFLYCVLAAVLYIDFAPRKYETACKVLVYKEVSLERTTSRSAWNALQPHTYLLTSEKLRQRVVDRLLPEWGERMGSEKAMLLTVSAGRTRSFGPTLRVSVRTGNRLYGAVFLKALLEEHQQEWRSMQMESMEAATSLLEDELDGLEEKIRSAEDDLIEYQRLHDIARVEARGSMETKYLTALIGRRNSLSTEMMLLEAQYPEIANAGVGVIGDVGALTRETGAIKPPESVEVGIDGEIEQGVVLGTPGTEPGNGSADDDDRRGWQELRVKLVNLRQQEKNLLENLKPEHPQLRQVRQQIANVKNQLEVAAAIELEKLRDRKDAIAIQLGALEGAEYKWQAKNLLASKRRSELKRIADVVSRFEDNYKSLYSKLHSLRVSEELKVDRFRLVEEVETDPDPVWPDPIKILMMALVAGLGTGFGIALLAQVMDNKVQSIKDVENVLGIPFLGGVPYWVHSGLEKAIRPIVTEQHSSGAIEAYRALRTSIISALNKINEKIVLITSADSREGKTLTTLNLAIMIAQMGKRVLMVDMDLRRGRLHRSMGIDRSPGMTDALRDNLPLREVIVPTRIDNMDIIPTGSSVDDSAELLQKADLVGMFAAVSDDYDYILCDTSPVLRVTDTVIAASQGLGVALYVARVNHTPKPLIQYSLDMLRDARVVGLIMNSIEMHKISSLYYSYQYPNYAYYSNAYAYGYQHYYYGDKGGEEDGGKRRRHRHQPGSRREAVKNWFRRNFLPFE